LWYVDAARGYGGLCTIIPRTCGEPDASAVATTLDALAGLAQAGVDLVACGTCVTHFGLGDVLRAGRVSDMQEIVQTMLAADKVVTV
jgi:sulfur relay (sulfurtransferase) complex TusBCD TusD component (DsrE family)